MLAASTHQQTTKSSLFPLEPCLNLGHHPSKQPKKPPSKERNHEEDAKDKSKIGKPGRLNSNFVSRQEYPMLDDDFYQEDEEDATGGQSIDSPASSRQASSYHLNMDRPPMLSIYNWLQENFEQYDGINLSREAIYADYAAYSHAEAQEIINSASFGKLIRSAFPSIKNRRLGIRGHSKYHYNGIRIKPNSYLLQTASASAESQKDSENQQAKMRKLKRATDDSREEEAAQILVGGNVQLVFDFAILPGPPSIIESGLSLGDFQDFFLLYHLHLREIVTCLNNLNLLKVFPYAPTILLKRFIDIAGDNM